MDNSNIIPNNDVREHKKYKCDQCKKLFKYQKDLRIHIATIHEGIRKYRCDKCGKSFTQFHVLHR